MSLNGAGPEWSFLLFLGGTVYVFFAFSALLLRPHSSEAPAWNALVGFGALVGSSIWTEMLARTLEFGPGLDVLRWSLMASGQIALLAFTLRSWKRLEGPSFLTDLTSWAPLMALGLGASLRDGTPEAWLRLGLGLPASLGAGLVLHRATRLGRTANRNLRPSAWMLALSGFPSAAGSFLPGGFLEPRDMVAPSLRILSALLVTGATFHLWWVGEPRRPRRLRDTLLLAGVLFVLGVGSWLVRRVDAQAHAAFLNHVNAIARFTADTLSRVPPEALKAYRDGTPHPQAEALRTSLTRIPLVWPEIREAELRFTPPQTWTKSVRPDALQVQVPVMSAAEIPMAHLCLQGHAEIHAERLGRSRLAPIFGTMLIILLLLAMDLGLRLERERQVLDARNHRERRDILEALDIQVWYLQDPYTYGLVNQAFAAYHGWFAEDLVGMPISRILTGERLERALTSNHHVFEKAQTLRFEQWEEDALGREHFLAISLVPRKDDEGRVVAVVGSAVNLTDRKRSEAARLELERQLAETHRYESLSRMAGAVAHHFNNLLGAALGSLELAQEALTRDHPAWRRIHRAREVTQKAVSLSQQMLTYLGRDAEIARQVLDPVQVLQPTLLDLQAQLPSHLRFDLDIPQSCPPLALDPAHLNAMVKHLVQNAVEALGERPGRIRIHLAPCPPGTRFPGRLLPLGWDIPPQGAVLLEVTDDGPGMPPDVLEHLFEPFFTTHFQGRGLGLASVLGMARTHGGAVNVTSHVGQGTTFRILFPQGSLSESLRTP